MNDFLKHMDAYSNDKLDKIMPSLNTNNNNQQVAIQNKIAE